MRTLAAALGTLVAALAALPASAPAQTTNSIAGAPGPGPAKYDRVEVTRFGPLSAHKVLVLVPGTIGGAGDFTISARALVERVPGLQVWAMDRRSQALEDTAMFRAALAGTRTPKQAFDYYLGWLGDPSITEHFQPQDPAAFPFARDWGLRLQVEDLRRVVRAARAGGRRKVVLGGHSLGASVAEAYASWDFGGRAGHRDLAALMLIDGGLMSAPAPTAAETRATIDRLQGEPPFLDLLGVGLPWAAGVFAETGGLLALRDPRGRSVVQDFPLLPAELKAKVPVTNRAALGFALDEDTSPDALGLIHVRAGALARKGDPRDWADGEVTPIGNVARTFAQEPANAAEWYFPKRLPIDTAAVRALRRTRALDRLGLRVWHRRTVGVPLYALQTSLSRGSVLRGARAFIRGSHVRRWAFTDATAVQSHLDPLTADPSRNIYVKTAAKFLRSLR